MAVHLTKRSITINGRRTSVALEDAFWDELGRIAMAKGMSLVRLIAAVEKESRTSSIASCLRVYALHNRTSVSSLAA